MHNTESLTDRLNAKIAAAEEHRRVHSGVPVGEPIGATLVVPEGETEEELFAQLREWSAAKRA